MVALEPTQQEGFIERAYYREPSLYEVEREYVFEHTWQYVGHESELAQPGAFKRATVAEQPLLVVRGSDGQIRVFLNSCRHRAAIVEPRDCGKAPAFRCIYHHWQYATDGRLINVPEASGFGEWFRKEDFGLVEVPKLESFNGLLFVSLDPEIEPLQQFLGPVTDHVREAFSTTGEPWQVITSYSYRIRANWKLFMENTV